MSTKSTAARWFEKLMEDTRKALSPHKRLLINTLLEQAVRMGDFVFPKIIYVSEVLARKVNKLQITMLESMLLASLWFGVICILALLVIMSMG